AGGGAAVATQLGDGRVAVRVPSEDALERARFMLALDDDTSAFHARFAHDRLLGPTVRALVGYRPLRVATVAHAALRAMCGQLIEAGRAIAIERSILRRLGVEAATRDDVLRLTAADLRRHGLAMSRATTLLHLCRTLDLERLHAHETSVVLGRLTRERGIGP